MSTSTFAAAANAIDYSDDVDELSSESEEVSDVSVAASSDDSDNGSKDDDDDDNDNDNGDTEEAVFLCNARDIQNRTSRCLGTAAMEDRLFRSLFGVRIEIVLKVWPMLLEDGLRPKKSKPKHLYPREAPGCSAVGESKGAIDPKTLRKWVWLFIERIAELADEVASIFLSFRRSHPRTPSPHDLPVFAVPIVAIPQIDFESRLGAHDVGNDCLMTIDGTDYRILQKGAARKGNAFGSFKYAGKSALRYELGVDILAGNLVWVSGPYPAGKYTNIAIFNNVLANCLKPGERVEADNGYVGRPDKIKCPNIDCNPAENRVMQGIARSRHETLNGRLKALGIPGNVYHHDIREHGTVFYACAIITQLSVTNGEPLFEVEYGDE
jgi:hypothetical protein